MYRFSIEGEDWILRFSPQVIIEAEEKQAILMSLLHIEMNWQTFLMEKLLSCLLIKLEQSFLMWSVFHPSF